MFLRNNSTHSAPRHGLRRRRAIVLAEGALAGPALVGVPAQARTAHPMTRFSALIPFEKFKLANGLSVIVHADCKAPIVAVKVWYHVASRNWKPGKSRFAHYSST
jgi:hypothetical protein